MSAALIAGAIGTLVAVLLSIPLHSPDDILFNAATVAAGGAITSIAAGLGWQALGRHVNRQRMFMFAIGAAFVAVTVALLCGEFLLERTASYAIPLATSIFGAIAALTPIIAKRNVPTWTGAVTLALVAALGIAFAAQGDKKTTVLSLPGAPSPTAAATTASTITALVSTGTGPTRTPNDVQGTNFAVTTASRAQFTVREKLVGVPLPNDATMQNTTLKGELHLDGRPSTVQLDLTAFSSDQSRRDNFIRMMFRAQPIATVTIDNIGGALPTTYVSGEVVKRTVSGKLRIQGFEAPIVLDVEARLEGTQLSVLGTTKFHWADYNLRAPSVAGTVQVEDEVSAQVLLVAQATQ